MTVGKAKKDADPNEQKENGRKLDRNTSEVKRKEILPSGAGKRFAFDCGP